MVPMSPRVVIVDLELQILFLHISIARIIDMYSVTLNICGDFVSEFHFETSSPYTVLADFLVHFDFPCPG